MPLVLLFMLVLLVLLLRLLLLLRRCWLSTGGFFLVNIQADGHSIVPERPGRGHRHQRAGCCT